MTNEKGQILFQSLCELLPEYRNLSIDVLTGDPMLMSCFLELLELVDHLNSTIDHCKCCNQDSNIEYIQALKHIQHPNYPKCIPDSILYPVKSKLEN